MGRSLHNRIHLGRRNALLNLRRLRSAGALLAISLIGLAVVWGVAVIE